MHQQQDLLLHLSHLRYHSNNSSFQVLITKLWSATNAETQQYRKASKALLVLIPLLGVTYVLVLTGPTEGQVANAFSYTRAAFLSSQVMQLQDISRYKNQLAPRKGEKKSWKSQTFSGRFSLWWRKHGCVHGFFLALLNSLFLVFFVRHWLQSARAVVSFLIECNSVISAGRVHLLLNVDNYEHGAVYL